MARAAASRVEFHAPMPPIVSPVAPRIHVGMGGWTFTPWRGSFYPEGLAQRRELEFASRQVTAIEINGTFYSPQKPETYARWHDETPEGFVFALKAPKFLTHGKTLARSPGAADTFIEGVLHLGDRLGPLLWQFSPSKRFEPEELERFIELLPREAGGRKLRHVIEVRHPSFACTTFIDLLRRQQVASVCTDSVEYPSFADLSTDFVYLRMMRTRTEQAAGYAPEELTAWAQRLRTWASGGEPPDLPRLIEQRVPRVPRDVYAFFISGAKQRNPVAAQALIARLR